MRFKIAATIPDDIHALTLEGIAPSIGRAEEQLEAARLALTNATAEIGTNADAIEQIRRDIALGIARPADLQAAIDRQRIAALSIVGFEQQVTSAETQLATVRAKAREEFREEALHRHAALARAIAEVAPLLEAVREAEAALDQAIARETAYIDGGMHRALAATPPLDWPSSLMADGARASAGVAFASIQAAAVPSQVPALAAARTTEAPVTPVIPHPPQVRSVLTPTPQPDPTPVIAVRRAPTSTQVEMPALDLRASVGAVHTDRTVDLTFSTGADVLRMDGMGTRYFERLSLQPKHVRLDRLNSGAPLLNAHSAAFLGDVIGVVLDNSATVDGRVGVAKVRFSRRPDVEPIFSDVKDKIIQNVSVGYRVHKFEETAGTNGALPIRTAIDWEPFEISLVPMGADAGARVRSTNSCEVIVRESGAA